MSEFKRVPQWQSPRSCRELGLLALAADAEGAGVFHSSKFPT